MKPSHVIAFVGLKGSGKTTAANFIERNLHYRRDSFAGPVKAAARIIFNLSWDQVHDPTQKEIIDPRWGLSPRQILQRLGTEVGRQFDEDIWIKSLLNRCEDGDSIVIDDCRFLNEAEAVKSVGGTVFGIQRPGLTPDNHPSELQMMECWDRMVDVTIVNDSTIENLYLRILEHLNGLRSNTGTL